MLSGVEIVAKGVTKLEATLPETGVKDVLPNGSWLEKKQIQAALEARKRLIEVERIEKSGVISHAVWKEELMLAEVTQKVGGYWQFLGHNVGKTLYLNPEEALFLMETNCLHLKFNDIPVSLQQAYSLLLREKITIFHYKVYASLSRLGFKVFRHKFLNCINNSKLIVEDKKQVVTTNEATNLLNNVESDKTEKDELGIEEDTHNGDSKTIEVVKKSKTSSETTEFSKIVESDEARKDESKMEEDTGSSDFKAIEKNIKIDRLKDVEGDEPRKDELRMEVCLDADSVCSKVMEDKKELTTSKKTDLLSDAKNDDTGTSESRMDIDTDIVNTETKNRTQNVKNDINNTSLIDTSVETHKDLMKMSTLLRLKHKNTKICSENTARKFFENFPNLLKKQIVSINAPDKKYLPDNIYLNKPVYTVNFLTLKEKNEKNMRATSTESGRHNKTKEISASSVTRDRSSEIELVQNNWNHFRNRCARLNNPFTHFNFRRTRPNFNFPQFQMHFHFQRPFMTNFFNFSPRFQSHRQMHSMIFRQFPNPGSIVANSSGVNNASVISNSRKRTRNSENFKRIHFEAIKNLALKIKLLPARNVQQMSVQLLLKIIQTYNMKYRTRLRLTEEYDVVQDENIVETIELDDDEESRAKKPRIENNDGYNVHFNKLSEIALILKSLETKNKASTKHKRALSNAIKTFNKCHSADIYMNEEYEIIDRRYITLDSSDSDCVVEEIPLACKKKLKNPFNILKRLAEKEKTNSSASTSKPISNIKETQNGTHNHITSNYITTGHLKYDEVLLKTFGKNWLPNENEFNRALLVTKDTMHINYSDKLRKEHYLYDFIKCHSDDFDNWLDLLVAFWESVEGTTAILQDDSVVTDNVEQLNFLVKPEDFNDMPSVIKKLSIIDMNKEIKSEASLKMDFDVYNRDVQNFRKTDPPKPHFRIVCIDEMDGIPTATDVTSLHARYNDGVTTVFAVVGIGSISYVQINSIDLPVYMPSNESIKL